MRRVPVYAPLLTEADARAAADAVRSGWVSSSGPELTRFEAAWASYCGMPRGVGVSSGTAALELAVRALGLGPGDEVLCPTFTILSCVRAILAAGATPILVDSDPGTYGLDLAEARAKVGPRTRAVLAVHVYGHPVDAQALADLARAHSLLVLEDAAEAHGAEALVDGAWRRCGGLGDASIFSFYGNKPITTGEGGIVLARSERVEASVRHQMNLCQSEARRFSHDGLGHNYRFTNVQAALGLAQLARIDEILARKRQIAQAYRARFERIATILPQATATWARPIHWMVGITLADDVGFDAAELGRRLAARGIDTRPYFLGMHEQPVFAARGLFAGERYPVAERLARRGLYLPSGLDLDEATIEHVCAMLREATSA